MSPSARAISRRKEPAAAPTATAPGMWTVGTDGGVFTERGGFFGTLGNRTLNAPVISMAATPSGKGYWLAALDGGVFTFGNAGFHGSMGGKHLNAAIVGMAATPSGKGYWLAALDGGVFTFGDAGFHGGMAGKHLDQPVAAITRTPSGKGYWLVARDGGVFAFGDAHYAGGLAGTHLNSPVSTMAATPSGHGYWLLGRDGGVFTFGDAGFHGSAAGGGARKVGIVPTSSGHGYWIVAADDTVRQFGDAFAVSAPKGPRKPVVGLATPWASSSGYALVLLELLRKPVPPAIVWPARGEVALTFDDGPSDFTLSMLSVLNQYGVHATFFDVGYEVAAHPDLVRSEVRSGMAVENHTWDHPQLTHLTPAQVADEFTRTSSAIRAASGETPRCYRPPYEDTNNSVRAEAFKLGLAEILWNVDPSDYERPGANVIAERVLSQADGRALVVGMHDGGGDRSQTIAALPEIITGLRARGYRFVRLCN